VIYLSVMKLLLFATLLEARETLKQLKTREESEGLYHFSKGLIVIMGWGSVNAHAATMKYGEEAEEIWNIGFAGALNSTFSLGSLFEVGSIGKHPLNEMTYTFPSGGKRLLTVDVPLHNKHQKEVLGKEWDLVDMEGYGIATAAAQLGKRVRLFKLCSDFAVEGGRNQIRENSTHYSSLMASFLSNLLLVGNDKVVA